MNRCLIITAVVLGLAGCSDPDAQQPDTDFLDEAPSAVVTGTLYNVATDGSNRRRTPGTVVLTGSNGSTVNGEVATDGTFEVRVLPGTYTISGTSPQPDGGNAQCATEATPTTVSAEEPTEVEILCVIQ